MSHLTKLCYLTHLQFSCKDKSIMRRSLPFSDGCGNLRNSELLPLSSAGSSHQLLDQHPGCHLYAHQHDHHPADIRILSSLLQLFRALFLGMLQRVVVGLARPSSFDISRLMWYVQYQIASHGSSYKRDLTLKVFQVVNSITSEYSQVDTDKFWSIFSIGDMTTTSNML